MGVESKPDFSGWASKAGILCADGRTIMPDAFKHQDQTTVPLVWQHKHNDPNNVLGHAILENRPEGVYAYGYFNDTPSGKQTKAIVEHGDVESLSIFANQLVEKSKKVVHGMIRELSVVLSGANPGALIDNVHLAHSDGELEVLEDEAVIFMGLALEHEDLTSNDEAAHADDSAEDGPTVQEVYDSMNEDQQNVVGYFVNAALEEAAAAHSATETTPDLEPDPTPAPDPEPTPDAALTHGNNDTEGTTVTHNVFEQNEGKEGEEHVLTHDAINSIAKDAARRGSLREAAEHYALTHGIENIDVLFPDARNVTETPEFDARRSDWVKDVLESTKHIPFTRIKSIVADITLDEARAKGYVKGSLKKEEFFNLVKRVTTPATVYKKQKLDRDDIIDITDFDVVTWLWSEMRLMLDEELARAILVGDGRDVDDDDKIKDPAGASEGAGVRSILNDDDLYAASIYIDDSAENTAVVDKITQSMGFYKGSGGPTFYTTLSFLTQLLTTRDEFNHRLWKTPAELAGEMGVSNIVAVEVMENYQDLLGIIVNLRDYSIGTDAGGEIAKFDDFDIDYNQYKYLLETRLSGALTKIRSALVFRKAAAANIVTPTKPSFDGTTVTIPTVTHITYKDSSDDSTLTGTVTLDEGESVHIYTVAGSGYYLNNNVEDEWTFTNTTSA